MLLEVKRTCLYQQCPVCSGKIFRYLLEGTYQSEEYGTTLGLKIWDRCEECREVFRETDIALDTYKLNEKICLLFTSWEQRILTDEDFAKGIQNLFEFIGGWITDPRQNTG